MTKLPNTMISTRDNAYQQAKNIAIIIAVLQCRALSANTTTSLPNNQAHSSFLLKQLDTCITAVHFDDSYFCALWYRYLFKGWVHCFTMQYKCFPLILKKIGTDPSCRLRDKRKRRTFNSEK